MKVLGGILAPALLVIAAVYVAGFRLQQGLLPSYDLYASFLPNTLYAVASLYDGGRGLLWNPFQSCGQPFFANPITGVLYPPYWLFAVLDPQRALQLVQSMHLVIAGLGMYWLARSLGIGRWAALAAALTFEMGNMMLSLSVWSPPHAGPYAWMPMALLGCECLLKRPTLGRGVVLGLVLAVAVLPGIPQAVLFAYQVIVLRVLWEIALHRSLPRTLVVPLVVGLTLPFLLAAVQFFPALEMTRESIRGRALTEAELYPFSGDELGALTIAVLMRSLSQPFMLIPCMLIGPALCARATRAPAAFYVTVGALYAILSLGPSSPLFDLYRVLPMGATFRDPSRLLWVTGLCLAMTTGLGCAALASGVQQARRGWAVALVLMAVPLVLLLLVARAALALPAWRKIVATLSGSDPSLAWFPPGSPSPWEWGAVVIVVLAAALARSRPRSAAVVGGALVAALLVPFVRGPQFSNKYQYRTLPPFLAMEPVFRTLQSSLTAQDRVYLVHEPTTKGDFSSIAKTASLFRVPSVLDYGALINQRYGDFSVRLRTGRRVRKLQDVLLCGPELQGGYRRPLLDLSAVRYLVVPSAQASAIATLRPPLTLRHQDDRWSVYENPQRLPRAFYVSRIEVMPEAAALLDRLADGVVDPRQLALVEETPPSGFLGGPLDQGEATVAFVRNDAEHLVLQLQAPARGFLVLSDQYYPGWVATVQGQSVPVMRANYVFRLVEVPAGESVVEFRYRPRSLWLGGAISAATLAGLLVVLLAASRSRWQT
jgi:hypothetical protein